VNYQLRLAPRAADDLQHLFEFLVEQDLNAAKRMRIAIGKAFEFLRTFPFTCRKAAPEHPFLREMVIEFGHAGYVALFEIEDNHTITVLAVRHQHEADFH
jgi:plasmid stabilization system protein ParE